MKDEFEKQLESQPMRGIPREWRSQILDSANRARRSTIVESLSAWLWPHPRAWAGLAAAWIIVFVFHVTAPDEPRAGGDSSPVTFQSFAAMQRQSLLMAQLLGSLDNADQPVEATAPPKPRSEGPRKQLIG